MKRIVYIVIALGVFIAILSVANQKADTQSIPVLRERCSYPYASTGYIKAECLDLIFQSVKKGQRPSHLTADQEGRVQWQ